LFIRWKYSDDSTNNEARGNESSPMFDSAFSHKKITLEGVTCQSEIFSSKTYFEKQQTPFSQESQDSEDEESAAPPIKTVQVGKFSGLHEIRLQVKTDDSIAGPQVTVDCNFGSLIALLTPIQTHIVFTLINELLDPEETRYFGFNIRLVIIHF
jgi:hypothetical protein